LKIILKKSMSFLIAEALDEVREKTDREIDHVELTQAEYDLLNKEEHRVAPCFARIHGYRIVVVD